MKKLIFLFTSLFSLTMVFAQNQERLSVHYFDIPENLEGQFMDFNKQINQELENIYAFWLYHFSLPYRFCKNSYRIQHFQALD